MWFCCFPTVSVLESSPFPIWKRLTPLWANDPRPRQHAANLPSPHLPPATPFSLHLHGALCCLLHRIPSGSLYLLSLYTFWSLSQCSSFPALLLHSSSGQPASAQGDCAAPSLVYVMPIWCRHGYETHMTWDHAWSVCLSLSLDANFWIVGFDFFIFSPSLHPSAR